MSGLEPLVAAALVAGGVAAAGTGVALATRPSTPKIPPPEAPPPPPVAAAPPPLAPTEADAGEGVANFRKKRARQFGLEQTLLAQQTPLGGANSLLQSPATGRRALLGG